MNQKKRISCLGDSITFGLMASGEEKSYPAVLQTLLGDGFCVKNFGRSGATVINDYDVVEGRYSPYIKAEEYKQALLSEPEIVILMLGMNDANPTHHFNGENNGEISIYYAALYREILEEMIEQLRSLSTKPTIYLVKTTQMRRTVEEGFSEDYVKHFTENLEVLRKVQEEAAICKKVHLIDTFDEMQEAGYYRDGCHLTDQGYEQLAKAIYTSIFKRR